MVKKAKEFSVLHSIWFDHVLTASTFTGLDADPTPAPSNGTAAPVPSLPTSENSCWSSKGPEVALIPVPPVVVCGAGGLLVCPVAAGPVGLTAPEGEVSGIADF